MKNKPSPPHRLVLIGLLSVAWTPVLYAQTAAGTAAPISSAKSPAVTEAESFEPRLIRGNDRVIGAPTPPAPIAGPTTNLRFENSPLADVVHVVLREIAKVDYVIHPPLSGSITLSTRAPISVDNAIFLLESALQANGLAMVRDARGTYHVGKPEFVRSIVPSVGVVSSGVALPPGVGTVVIPLRYIGATEMAAILRPTLGPGAIARVDNLRNLLVMTGTRAQAEGWMEVVNTFDIDLLKGMSVGVFPLKHLTTRDVEAAFRLLAGSPDTGGAAAPQGAGAAGSGAASAATPISGAAPRGAPSAANVASGSFPLFGAVRIMPIERINSILVVTPRAAYLDEARAWIEKLDQPNLNGTEPQLFVYPVQNGSAAHLASVLNGLFGGGAGGVTQTATDSGVAPGLRPLTTGSTGGTGAFGSAAGAGLDASRNAARTGSGSAGVGGITSLSLASGVRIIADNLNNAILVYGSRGEYEKINAALKRLDVPLTQVRIEASIIEVSLTDDLQYGLQWLFTDQRGSWTGAGGLDVMGAIAGGFSYTLRNPAGQVQLVLKALAEKSLIKVISSPSLMVLDNHTASISVGNQQPVRTSQTVTDGGNVTNAIQYKDTGVSLSVTPSVTAGDMVTMQINQAVTDVGPEDLPTGQRSFLQRQIASKVAVRSGETLVLGGLIRDNTTSGDNGLPYLKDVPVLGLLFGARGQNTNRTELLVVITPRVVRNDDDMRALSEEYRDRVKTLNLSLPSLHTPEGASPPPISQ